MNIPYELMKTACWAAQCHSAQRRHGPDSQPYVNHLLEVAELVAEAGGSLEAIQAALLHDSVEDQNIKYEHLLELFGKKVANLVIEVTDDPNLSKEEQRAAQVVSMPSKSFEAKLIKIADQTSNVRSLSENSPKWSLKSKIRYLEKTRNVVNAGRGTSEFLEKKFDFYAEQAQNYLNDQSVKYDFDSKVGLKRVQ